jgi:hypothetical protein
MNNVIKFPYDVSRRVHSKKPRRSKNGTPEERAAKEAAEAAAMPRAAANVVTLSRDQLTPLIVDRVERIVAKYNQLELENKAIVSDLIRALVDRRVGNKDTPS